MFKILKKNEGGKWSVYTTQNGITRDIYITKGWYLSDMILLHWMSQTVLLGLTC